MQRTWVPEFSLKVTRRRGAFTPLALTALQAWYKSDTGITIATGVSQWDDQSGQNHHLLQATAGFQPTVTAGAINGLPAVTFDGVDDRMAASFTLAQPETVFIVFRQDSWTLNEFIVDGTAASTMGLSQRVATPNLSLTAAAAVANNTNLALSTFGLATCIYNGASSSLQINSTTATTGNIGAGTPNGITLGASGTGTLPAACAIAEVIVMAAVATASEIALVKAYVTARYGFAA